MEDVLSFKVKGKTVLIDAQDVAIFGAHSWYIDKNGYVMTRDRSEFQEGRLKGLHRYIMNAEKGFTVDHLNHNPQDNRRCNLRICLQGHNTKNTSKHKDSKNKFKGITRKPNGKYAATIGYNYKTIYLGVFETQEEAAAAYNKAAIHYFGEFASLNRI